MQIVNSLALFDLSPFDPITTVLSVFGLSRYYYIIGMYRTGDDRQTDSDAQQGFTIKQPCQLICVCVCSTMELLQRCQLLSTELTELRQSFASEQRHRSHTEDLLRQAQDQLAIQQQMTACANEQASFAIAVAENCYIVALSVFEIY